LIGWRWRSGWALPATRENPVLRARLSVRADDMTRRTPEIFMVMDMRCLFDVDVDADVMLLLSETSGGRGGFCILPERRFIDSS